MNKGDWLENPVEVIEFHGDGGASDAEDWLELVRETGGGAELLAQLVKYRPGSPAIRQVVKNLRDGGSSDPMEGIRLASEQEQELLHSCAEALIKVVSLHKYTFKSSNPFYSSNSAPSDILRIADDYIAKSTWVDVLSPHGWVRVAKDLPGKVCWRMPGKDGTSARLRVGISAFSDYDFMETLYVFKTNSNPSPFFAGCSYDLFTGYTFLNHGGNYPAAAMALGKEGYGA